MPTLKTRKRCEQCRSRRTLDNLFPVVVHYSEKSTYKILLCKVCYDKVSKTRLWTPSYPHAKSYPISF